MMIGGNEKGMHERRKKREREMERGKSKNPTGVEYNWIVCMVEVFGYHFN
jgi:hypothetical protein